MSESLLDRYNQAYNTECSGLAHGGPISMEHLQAMTLESFVRAMDWDHIYTADGVKNHLEILVEDLYKQGKHNVNP
jgi:hypothetical protein